MKDSPKKIKNLHRKAFTTNSVDPDYHKITTLNYEENGKSRETAVPKGDILSQFRKDVNEGTLPTVSWLVAPEKFSDHPTAPWYGAWYISEVLDILTKNPDVWKKTIFILSYDENDGYFDHIPPFVVANPKDPQTGKVSEGLDTTGEYVTIKEELEAGFDAVESRTGPVGLGYRVPLIVASPWSRGGWVNSEVFDITSTIRFLENFLYKKTGKKIIESNISSWRRAITGDLSSVFRPYQNEALEFPEPIDRNSIVKQIYNASFKDIPKNYKVISAHQIESAITATNILPKQEAGIKPSCALKYELQADGNLTEDKKYFEIRFEAAQNIFGEKALGSGFNVYAPGKYKTATSFEMVKTWAFSVKSGVPITYLWPLSDFENECYHLRVYGPNGYFREFSGNNQTSIHIECKADTKNKEHLILTLKNSGNVHQTLVFSENVYRHEEKIIHLPSSEKVELSIDPSEQKGWYEFSVTLKDNPSFFVHYAGRTESGKHSTSDPLMGGVLSSDN